MSTTAIFLYLLILAPILYTQGYAAKSFCPWVPTRKKDLERLCRFAALEKGQKFVDLGCGDGRVVRYFSRHSEADCLGIELSLPHFLYAKFVGRARSLGRGRRGGEIRYGSLLNMDLTDVDAVFVYGYPTTLQSKLKPKLERELKPGAKFISYRYPIYGFDVAESDRGAKRDDAPIFAYRF